MAVREQSPCACGPIRVYLRDVSVLCSSFFLSFTLRGRVLGLDLSRSGSGEETVGTTWVSYAGPCCVSLAGSRLLQPEKKHGAQGHRDS